MSQQIIPTFATHRDEGAKSAGRQSRSLQARRDSIQHEATGARLYVGRRFEIFGVYSSTKPKHVLERRVIQAHRYVDRTLSPQSLHDSFGRSREPQHRQRGVEARARESLEVGPELGRNLWVGLLREDANPMSSFAEPPRELDCALADAPLQVEAANQQRDSHRSRPDYRSASSAARATRDVSHPYTSSTTKMTTE